MTITWNSLSDSLSLFCEVIFVKFCTVFSFGAYLSSHVDFLGFYASGKTATTLNIEGVALWRNIPCVDGMYLSALASWLEHDQVQMEDLGHFAPGILWWDG